MKKMIFFLSIFTTQRFKRDMKSCSPNIEPFILDNTICYSCFKVVNAFKITTAGSQICVNVKDYIKNCFKYYQTCSDVFS